MHARRLAPLALPALLSLSGCGYVHVGRLQEPTVTTVVGDESLRTENLELRREKTLLQQELALTRAQGEALRSAIQNRAADGDTSKRLVEKLNETSKELAALRTSYAQLQNERTQAFAGNGDAALKARLGAAEEKLASSLRGYTQLQEEIARLKTDVARTRAENLALSAKVKVVTAQNEQAQAALAQLNLDLRTQKDARLQAEQDAETLRGELRNVAPHASALAQQRTGAASDARSLVAQHAAEIAALRQQLETFRSNVQSLTAERAALAARLGNGGASTPAPELAHVEARLATALRSAAMLREENVQLKSTSAQLSDQLAAARRSTAPAAQVQELREQLRETQAYAISLTEENARLKTRLLRPDGEPAQLEAGASVSSTGSTTAPSPAPSVAPKTPGLTIRPSGVNATLVAKVQSSTRPAIARSNDTALSRTHTVSGGDTLAKISAQYYGTPGRWGDILAANRDVLGETNNLVVGRMLRIP